MRALSILFVLLVACGGNQPDATAPSPAGSGSSATPSSTTSSGNVSQEGGECGDDVAIQKKCAPGLVCAPKPNAPVSEHTPGICKKQ